MSITYTIQHIHVHGGCRVHEILIYMNNNGLAYIVHVHKVIHIYMYLNLNQMYCMSFGLCTILIFFNLSPNH